MSSVMSMRPAVAAAQAIKAIYITESCFFFHSLAGTTSQEDEGGQRWGRGLGLPAPAPIFFGEMLQGQAQVQGPGKEDANGGRDRTC